MSPRASGLLGVVLSVATAVPAVADSVPSRDVHPAAEALLSDVTGAYRGPDGRRWAVELTGETSLVMYALSHGHCVAPGTLVSSGVWDGSAFAMQTPLYDVDPDTGRCAASMDADADRIVVVDRRTIDFCPAAGGCLRMVRPLRYEVEFSAWIPHAFVADPYLPGPVAGLPDDLVDLAPPGLRECLGSEQVESTIAGQNHVGLVEPMLVTVSVAFTLSETNEVTDVETDAPPMRTGRDVFGYDASGAHTMCAQDVTQSGRSIATVGAHPGGVVIELHAGLGIVPARRDEIDAAERAVLERMRCDDVELSCDLRYVALGSGQIDATVVLQPAPDGSIVVRASTDAFPSFGLTVREGRRATRRVVLHDSSCYAALGLAGVFNVLQLLHTNEQRGEAPLDGWADDVCESRALEGDMLPTEFFGSGRAHLAAFLLGVRWAAGRS